MGADTAPLLASQRDGASAAADITSLEIWLVNEKKWCRSSRLKVFKSEQRGVSDCGYIFIAKIPLGGTRLEYKLYNYSGRTTSEQADDYAELIEAQWGLWKGKTSETRKLKEAFPGYANFKESLGGKADGD